MDEWQQDFLQSSPMFEPLREAGRPIEILNRWPMLGELNALLSPEIHTAGGAPIRFVAQGAKPTCIEDKYEARIHLKGEVQTRIENWHDLFNALVWLAFPRTKRALNTRHFASIVKSSGEGNRDKTQDALTLFDESGVIVLYSDDELADLLLDFQWRALFWERRQSLTEQMQFIVFGHSLYEKALNPYIGFTGKGLPLKVDNEFFSLEMTMQQRVIDELMMKKFSSGWQITARDMTPVPLLGVPGWWPGNEDVVFYANTRYFRPGRSIPI